MGYKVTDTKERSKLSPAGSEIVVYRVWIITDKGATGVVDVSPDNWNAVDLAAILQEKAEALDLAFSLTG